MSKNNMTKVIRGLMKDNKVQVIIKNNFEIIHNKELRFEQSMEFHKTNQTILHAKSKLVVL
jgi:hypothetical protein